MKIRKTLKWVLLVGLCLVVMAQFVWTSKDESGLELPEYRGFAALLAESLWLSADKELSCGYAAPEAEPQNLVPCSESQRLSARRAAEPRY